MQDLYTSAQFGNKTSKTNSFSKYKTVVIFLSFEMLHSGQHMQFQKTSGSASVHGTFIRGFYAEVLLKWKENVEQ